MAFGYYSCSWYCFVAWNSGIGPAQPILKPIQQKEKR